MTRDSAISVSEHFVYKKGSDTRMKSVLKEVNLLLVTTLVSVIAASHS